MTPELTPDEARELLGAYALNALDPDERAQVDRYLLVDATARAELHELEHAAAWLGHASLRPPARAADTIATEIAAERSDGAPAPAPADGATTPAPHRLSRWLVAAAAVAVLAVGAGGIVAITNNHSGSTSTAERAQAALRDESARTVTLRSDDGQFTAHAVVLPDRTGYMLDASMPELPAGRAFQLWSITPSGPVSAGVLRRGVQEFRIAGATTALAVTEEPRGGSSLPSGEPVVSADLRSV